MDTQRKDARTHSQPEPILFLLPPKTEDRHYKPEEKITLPTRKSTGRTVTAIAKTLMMSFSALIYLAVIAAGLLSVLETGMDRILLSEVFNSEIVTLHEGGNSVLPIPSTDNAPPTAEMPTATGTGNGLTIHITDVDHSASSIYEIYNETSYDPDEDSLLASRPAYKNREYASAMYGVNAPLVLVIHTHGTEAYTEDGVTECSADESFRSTDTDKNVVAVGNAFCETLEKCGIKTIHCTEMFDRESIRTAYDDSAAAVRAYLAEYPSIEYVFDIHRDALLSSDGEYLAPTFSVGDDSIAEVMLVIGTDAAGAYHPEWKQNLTFALDLQSHMLSSYPGMARGYNLRTASFNQQLSDGFLLVEVGSCANTLAEAKRAAGLFALTLYKTIEGSDAPIGTTEILAQYR